MVELSIVLPSIRCDKWQRFVDSANLSCKNREFEIIFVGPESVPVAGNIKHIKSYSSPVSCIQKGAIHAEGEYLSVSCDDGSYFEDAIDKCFDILDSHNRSHKTVVTCKYLEGHRKKDIRVHEKPSYYAVNSSPATKSKFLPNWWIFNLPFMKTDYFKELGGLDCRFEAQAMAMTDLANRAQMNGSEVYLPEFMLMDIEHTPGAGGDHGPIYYAQVENDQPLYGKIYSDSSCKDRIKIDFDNWKNAPENWPRRKR